MEIQREPFEWMVKPTPQREWIEGRGLILWLAFCWGMGGGLYLVSLYFNSLWGMFIGWLIIALGKCGFHLLYLGRPLRFWRALFRPQSSWLSRGIIFVAFFLIMGAIQMPLSYWQPGTAAEVVFKVMAGTGAFLTAIYTGFAMGCVRAVPFWNSSLLPVLFALYAILGGCGIALAMGLNWNIGVRVEGLEWGVRGLLSAGALMLVIYMWSVRYGSRGSKEAVVTLLRGPRSFSLPFWLGLIVIGTVIPLAIVWYSSAGEIATQWLYLAIACEFIGGLALRYSLLKGGVYASLIDA
ncbi:DmsC/YnfH family molybdoenzyme membrane anchor subunit [Chloroflexota bacterium]